MLRTVVLDYQDRTRKNEDRGARDSSEDLSWGWRRAIGPGLIRRAESYLGKSWEAECGNANNVRGREVSTVTT